MNAGGMIFMVIVLFSRFVCVRPKGMVSLRSARRIIFRHVLSPEEYSLLAIHPFPRQTSRDQLTANHGFPCTTRHAQANHCVSRARQFDPVPLPKSYPHDGQCLSDEQLQKWYAPPSTYPTQLESVFPFGYLQRMLSHPKSICVDSLAMRAQSLRADAVRLKEL